MNLELCVYYLYIIYINFFLAKKTWNDNWKKGG